MKTKKKNEEEEDDNFDFDKVKSFFKNKSKNFDNLINSIIDPFSIDEKLINKDLDEKKLEKKKELERQKELELFENIEE
jgi:hypothetical protein